METENEYIQIKYQIGKWMDKIKIFGDWFVYYNKKKCKIEINGEESELLNNLTISEKMKSKSDELEIKLYILNDITDISNMFCSCKSLISISNLDKINFSKITKMNFLFQGCQFLKSLSGISNWDTSNITSMDCLFNGCKSLTSLPDISNWNTSKVFSMNHLFDDCVSLKSLPDISKWDLSNVNSMYNLFHNCVSLKSLPDISKWNISKVENIKSLFEGCRKLISLPDISKWNTWNVENINYIFKNCIWLTFLPDIEKWDLSNLSTKENIFENCPPSISSKIKKEKNKINENINVRILILGDENVGKKSLFKQFKFKNYEKIEPMVASSRVSEDWNTYIKKIITGNIFDYDNNLIFNFELKNFANYFRWNFFPPKIYHLMDIIFFVYDVNNKASFENLDAWYNKVIQDKGLWVCRKKMFVVIANKIDLNKNYNKQSGQNFAKKIGADFYECSALDYHCVSYIFKNTYQKYIKNKIYENTENHNNEDDSNQMSPLMRYCNLF